MGIPLLTGNQSRKAVHYSVLWLLEELKDILEAIENEADENVKKFLVDKKVELKKDYEIFSRLSDQ